MLIKTKGIVLRTIKYGETSIICDIYTYERGLRSFIVNGVRKPKAKIHPSLFQLMSLLDLVIYDKASKSLNRIKEVKAHRFYSDIPFNVLKSSIGTFIVEVCQKSIKEKEQNIELFEFLEDWLLYLDQCKKGLSKLPLLFMIELAQVLGFRPNNNYSEIKTCFNLLEGSFEAQNLTEIHSLDIPNSKNLSALLQYQKENIDQFSLGRNERKRLLNALIKFYQCHVQNFTGLNTVKVLEEVLN